MAREVIGNHPDWSSTMLIRQAPDIRSSEITPERLYRNRREFIRTASGAVAGAIAAGTAFGPEAGRLRAQEPIPNLLKSPLSTDEPLNSFADITTYNNFYEFGLDKGDPARYSHDMTIDPWSVRVEGEMNKPAADVPLETLLRPHPLEERIYRLRCVEAWSMVVPWVGFPLGDLIKRFEPTSRAKYIRFETLYRPSEMRGQRGRSLDWPYVGGAADGRGHAPPGDSRRRRLRQDPAEPAGRPRCGWSCRGSTVSRASSPSSRSSSWRTSRGTPGTWRFRTSTASIRT